MDEPILYIYADKLPRLIFNGGLHEYIYSNIQWPGNFHGEGVVLISFIVKKDGKITNIKVERSLCPFCDEEVLSVFNSMPDWEPGEVNYSKVDIKLYMPIEFKIKN
ncbi:MAG: TonB family protein [Ignavibacteria bacterium]|nr:TonB family protein [Ignavibacteria bacterium]